MKLIITTVEGDRVGEVSDELTPDLSVADDARDAIMQCIRHGHARQKPDIGEGDADEMTTPPEEFETYQGVEALQRVQHALKYTTPYRGELVTDDV